MSSSDSWKSELAGRVARRRWNRCYDAVNDFLDAVNYNIMQEAAQRLSEVRHELIEAGIPVPASLKEAHKEAVLLLSKYKVCDMVLKHRFGCQKRDEDYIHYAKYTQEEG